MNNPLRDVAAKAARYFLHPDHVLTWEQIIRGFIVTHPDGRLEKIIAVGPNTFRGFHRLEKSHTGPQETFMDYFVAAKRRLVTDLGKIRTASDLHRLANRIRAEIIAEFYNIDPRQLLSYNKVRQPVDLYLEHLVRMARELQHLRPALIPLLHLPLDSQTLDQPAIFAERELRLHGLSRGLTYSDITREETYLALQQLAQDNANDISSAIGTPFHRIYYDMHWNNRLAN